MRRMILAACAVAIAGCGASPSRSPSTSSPCNPAPGNGVMGICIPHRVGGSLNAPRGALLPDVSEYQGCPRWQEGIPGVTFRVYEAGTGLQDRSAACNARRLRQIGAWDAAYAFLRPGSCTGQADRTVAILRAVGGISGPVVADAEVPLPAGFVACFDARVARDMGNDAQVDYSAPGTWPGGSPTRPVWVATYGPAPGCVGGVCSHVAWQFSEDFNCHGLVGDCSLDTGITAIRQHVLNRRLLAERELLRADLIRHRCRVAPYHGRGRYHRVCARWLKRGRVIDRELR